MKILIYSPLFHPSVGGTETVNLILAREFVRQGQAVKVVCQTPATGDEDFPFEVIRRPDGLELLRLTRWCDVYFQGCVSLKGLWNLLLVPKPLVVTHHTWYSRPDGRLGLQDRLKRWVTHWATNVCISDAIAQKIPAPSTIIPNPYWDNVFRLIPNVTRDRELIFLGRFVSDKGADLLIKALHTLKKQELTPHLTLVGQGPEEENLRQQVRDLNLTQQVDFVGIKVGEELAQLLNVHQILVVPSRWQEPFGIVALEGIACGCVAVGSQGGGLQEAIGFCGITFPNGNVRELTTILSNLLTHPQQLLDYQSQAKSHLKRHQKAQVAREYLSVLEAATQ
ncbi:glycosyltransferase family 4 protein [Lusitaniella coriacea LEGE 07157]|uniref:Glycosyltransferase family 4 protein n=1 Tax=Lusitaniella coriacea LEGE 07157 TaxID=945747 RepID=A0A8J7DWJ5_9CYAN|nr:glycosyltransferase family 4 protein [Lusitaniella coriacea]MBE9116135.1 glycosyltransferase family 4 protein [Lusitaniella coriacea LEGE 07157]